MKGRCWVDRRLLAPRGVNPVLNRSAVDIVRTFPEATTTAATLKGSLMLAGFLLEEADLALGLAEAIVIFGSPDC